jgi:5-methylthioadenosine/S-adenosylhomocysteine deaminase
VVSCPVSNAYLASGPAPISDLLADGVTVALGCDGAATNNSQNMFEVVKWAVLSDRLRTLDSTRLTEVDALRMVWDGGAAALGLAGQVGRLESGYLADLFIVDVTRGAYTGTPTLRRGLVFGGSPADVTDVWVGGCQVVRSREVTTVDEQQIGERTLRRVRQLASPTAPGGSAGHPEGSAAR